MIHKDDLFPVGQINKTHGIRGEMSFSLSADVFNSEELPFLFFEPEGILVPFAVDACRLKSSSTGILHLEGVDSEEDARIFVGQHIYIEKKFLQDSSEIEFTPNYFIGFSVKDLKYGPVGRISEIDDSTKNILFTVRKDDGEILIPASEAYIEAINHDDKILLVNLPEGLLEL